MRQRKQRVETWKQEIACHIWGARSGWMQQRAGQLKEVQSGTEVCLGMLGRVHRVCLGRSSDWLLSLLSSLLLHDAVSEKPLPITQCKGIAQSPTNTPPPFLFIECSFLADTSCLLSIFQHMTTFHEHEPGLCC